MPGYQRLPLYKHAVLQLMEEVQLTSPLFPSIPTDDMDYMYKLWLTQDQMDSSERRHARSMKRYVSIFFRSST